MIVLGVDPGIRGAIALLRGQAVSVLEDLPTHTLTTTTRKSRDELDAHGLHGILADEAPIDAAFIEQVGPMPRQGVVSTYRFGYSAGVIYGILTAMGIAVHFVPPKVWQRHHRIGPEPDASRQRAVQLYPGVADCLARKRDNHRSDALLLAAYGASLNP